jgi:hypothetical protein
MSVVSFPESVFAHAAFDAEVTGVLGLAFEAAWQVVRASGEVAGEEQAVAIRECLAKRMIEMARRGERSPDRLVADALLYLAKSRAAPEIAVLSAAELPAAATQGG